MNMAGNLAAFATALAFPYLQEWTGSTTPYFMTAAASYLVGTVILRSRGRRCIGPAGLGFGPPATTCRPACGGADESYPVCR